MEPAPILDPATLARQLERRRARGDTVALANGCFDLLHVGHIRYLRAAADEAEILVVGVNDDASVTRLKGAGRPLLPARDRAELLTALECVDYVTVFAGDTADELIRTLLPDVHCKGTDYRATDVPEANTVRQVGGRVAIVGDRKEHSTRSLITSLQRGSR